MFVFLRVRSDDLFLSEFNLSYKPRRICIYKYISDISAVISEQERKKRARNR